MSKNKEKSPVNMQVAALVDPESRSLAVIPADNAPKNPLMKHLQGPPGEFTQYRVDGLFPLSHLVFVLRYRKYLTKAACITVTALIVAGAPVSLGWLGATLFQKLFLGLKFVTIPVVFAALYVGIYLKYWAPPSWFTSEAEKIRTRIKKHNRVLKTLEKVIDTQRTLSKDGEAEQKELVDLKSSVAARQANCQQMLVFLQKLGGVHDGDLRELEQYLLEGKGENLMSLEGAFTDLLHRLTAKNEADLAAEGQIPELEIKS